MDATERTRLCTELLQKMRANAPLLEEIDALKLKLRESGKTHGGFTERVTGLGMVEVKAGRDAKFKGLTPELDPELFLAMGEDERKKLQDDGVVKIAAQYTRPFFGSITATPLPAAPAAA